MSEFNRPTATGRSGAVPRYGMYAGPNYAGGRALGADELPTAQDWQVRPIGFLDDVTRNHDINYTYIEKVYQGNDPASRSERNLALWQADKEMLGNMLRYQLARGPIQGCGDQGFRGQGPCGPTASATHPTQTHGPVEARTKESCLL
jgi:hypothetical protein